MAAVKGNSSRINTYESGDNSTLEVGFGLGLLHLSRALSYPGSYAHQSPCDLVTKIFVLILRMSKYVHYCCPINMVQVTRVMTAQSF